MNVETARSIARHLAGLPSGSSEAAGLRAAMVVGGFDPATTLPDAPVGYNERAASTARAVNPGYLTTPELEAKIAAAEHALGGRPF